MKKVISTLILLSTLPSLALANVDSSFIKDKRLEKNTQLLFVMLSKEASISATDKKDTYNISLKGINPHVIYFSNSPVRISGKVDTTNFVGQWKDGAFKKVAPNAMIEAVVLDQRTHQLQHTESSYAVTMYNPVYSADHKNLSFEIKALPGTTLPTTGTSDYVAVFVDPLCVSCVGG